MEYKLSDIIAGLNKRDYLGRCMIVETDEYIYETGTHEPGYLTLRYHTMPSYGYYDPDFEDTDEWYDNWWNADITFKKETGLITSTGLFLSTESGAQIGDTVIIDIDYSDYLCVDDEAEED